MEISLNGKKRSTRHSTLQALIRETGFDPESLIVELNFEIIKQEYWSQKQIKDGDQIEMLNFVGGG